MENRRFLVSARWDADGFEPYTRFFERELSHPGLAWPIDVFFQEGVLCSVTHWLGEGLLLDEGAPLPVSRVMDIAQRTTGIIAFLHHKGISLDGLKLSNFLVYDDQEIVLFDLDVAVVQNSPIDPSNRHVELASFGEILRRFTPVTETSLQSFFFRAEGGFFASPLEFGRAMEDLLSKEFDSLRGSAGAMTDVGLCRVLNEDNWGWTHLGPDIDLYVVADGMGGHDAGEVASMMAVQNICRETKERLGGLTRVTPELLENVLEESFRAANNSIKDTVMYGNRQALVANVGDSRAYLLRQEILHQITRDHSLVARMVEQNRLTAEEARVHPHSNILLRTVGTERDVDVDIFSVELEPGDAVLMCSDGLWGDVEDSNIQKILNHFSDPRLACRELVRAAHHGGGKDNVTVQIVQVPS
jgi:protein phosphatase